MKTFLLYCLMTSLTFIAPLHAQDVKLYRIVFWTEEDIYTINADGSGLYRMRYNPAYYASIESVAWSPDGQKLILVIVSAEDGMPYLYIADGDADNPRRFLPTPVTANASPRWSPDGAHLIFRNGANIFWVDGDGDNQHLLLDGYTLRSMPRWSPDGRQLAYLSGDLGSLSIHLLDPETGTSRQIVHEMTNGSMQWSPTGEYIAFQYETPEPEAFTVNIETGQIVQLIVEPDGSDFSFDWSPDGSQIAINSSRAGTNIFTVRPDGSNLQQITFDNATMYTYSPDGQWIAFWFERDIWIMHPDGSDARQMTFDEVDNRLAGWSPDSANLLVFRFGEQHRLSIVDVETTAARELPNPTDGTNIRIAEWIEPYIP